MAIKGIEQGIRRKVEAKLRERGLAHDQAACVAEQQHRAALAFFNQHLSSGTAAGEVAYELAFDALSRWAASIPL